jgi:hypothetical protein
LNQDIQDEGEEPAKFEEGALLADEPGDEIEENRPIEEVVEDRFAEEAPAKEESRFSDDNQIIPTES